MARNIRGQYRSAKEQSHEVYGKNLELVVERLTTNFMTVIRKWADASVASVKEATERLKDRGALEGEFHVISDNQLLIGVDDASVSGTVEDCTR